MPFTLMEEDMDVDEEEDVVIVASPSCRSTKLEPSSMSIPASACTGTNQLLRRPKLRKKHESTMGAHSNLSEKGQLHKANMALARYVRRSAEAIVVAATAAAPPAAAAAAEESVIVEAAADAMIFIFC